MFAKRKAIYNNYPTYDVENPIAMSQRCISLLDARICCYLFEYVTTITGIYNLCCR